MGNLPTLINLVLHENRLAGRVPPEIGKLVNLETLSLARNAGLQGLLPRELSALVRLKEFSSFETGVCPPLEPDFREWLEGVETQGFDECRPADVERLALAEFFTGTGGASWTNGGGWNSDAPLGDWHGVAVTDGRVRGIALADNGLAGQLGSVLANLTELEVLELGGNQLAGELPAAIGSMESLTRMSVSGNRQLEGVLPFRLTELAGLDTLEYTDTGLCASPSPTFQDWLGAVGSVAGPNCVNPDAVGLSLPVVYLTQAIQRPLGRCPARCRQAGAAAGVPHRRPFARLLRAPGHGDLHERRRHGAHRHHEPRRRPARKQRRRERPRPLLQRRGPRRRHHAGSRAGRRGRSRQRGAPDRGRAAAFPGHRLRGAERGGGAPRWR